jgi:hypothetical protein
MTTMTTMSAQMMATSTSRTMARSASKMMSNDSIAFYPSATQQNRAAKKAADSFGFSPSTGATRIPTNNISKPAMNSIRSKEQQSLVCKYSRVELDSMFSKSRVQKEASRKSTSTRSKTAAESFSFYPTRRSGTNTISMNTSKDVSFGYYSSNGVAARNSKKVATKTTTFSTSSQENASSSTGSDNNMSLFAASSFAMGFFVQAGRTFARP